NKASAVAIGNNAESTGDDAYALGKSARASGNQSTAIGPSASATKIKAVSIGNSAQATGDDGIAMGSTAKATGNQSVAISFTSQAKAQNAVAIGTNAIAGGSNSVAIGTNVNVTNGNTIALGDETGNIRVGIGTNSPSRNLHVKGNLRIEDGTQSAGRVLTSDANGNASWQSISGIPQIVAAGLVQANGTAIKITGATVTRLNLGDYQVTFTSARASANYIINLANIDCGGNCGGTSYDDPGITYYDRETTGFKVNIGDSDNGNTQKADIDLEFTFSVIDF
ncbi:MAG: hypothetical protein VX253_09085, partial [Bacteroidota bacterium]|nr:hypothetical protein [Bacteroidota bacterium]